MLGLRASVAAALLLAPGARARGGRWAAFAQPGWGHDAELLAAGADEQVLVILALRQSNLPYLEERLQRVSDPAREDYGRYLLREEVARLASPSEADVAAVREFLGGLPGTAQFSKGRDLVRFVCSVECVEGAFGTRIARQRSPTLPGHSPFRATAEIRLPERVAAALDGVSLNAPVFMPARPKPQARVVFQYPAGGREAPRLHPSLTAGDGFVSFRFVAYCANQRVNRDRLEDGICSSSSGGPSIRSFLVVVLQEPSMQEVRELPAIPNIMGQREGNCTDATPCVEFNITLAVANYANTTVMIRSHYSDGSTSLFSGVEEILPVWPLPYATPHLLSKFYQMQLSQPISHPRNIISVAEFGGQYYNPADIETFFRLMGLHDFGSNSLPRLVGLDKPIAGSVLGNEAQLDIQYIMAMAANVTTWFWSVPGTELATRQEPFLNWLMSVADCEDHEGPLVHSVSYADEEAVMPEWFKRRVNAEFMKLGLRGISVIVASGDNGAYLSGNASCDRAAPGFPSSSPWVTSVGGTQLAMGAAPVCGYSSRDVTVTCHDEAEVVCTSERGGVITSGGGFSNDFPAPWYQQEAVGRYLRQPHVGLPLPEEWYYNSSGRGFPDVAAISASYLVWMGDELQRLYGTSASTPLVAAMVAQWNEMRLQRGQPPLGFLNPLLYALSARRPEAFNDVLTGNNRCSMGASAPCCSKGFPAAGGWDAASGVGSPRFDVLSELLDVDALRRIFRGDGPGSPQPGGAAAAAAAAAPRTPAAPAAAAPPWAPPWALAVLSAAAGAAGAAASAALCARALGPGGRARGAGGPRARGPRAGGPAPAGALGEGLLW